MRTGRPAELVMGSVQLGLSYGATNRTGKPPRDTALRLVRRAANAGVSVFDTARSYGDAEERLGAALAGRRAVRTITKLDPLNDLAPDATPASVCAAVDQSVAESLAALRLQTLNCVLLHRAEQIASHGGAIWRRLQEHMADGTIQALGISAQTPAEALAALSEAAVTHIQLPFNILDWRWRESGLIAGLEARRSVTVHARSVFLQGVLTAGDPKIWPRISGVDAPATVAWLTQTAKAFRRDSVADLALAFARGQSWIDGVVVGQETEAQLDENLRLCSYPPLSVEDCATIAAGAPRLPATFLNPARWPPQ
ncbi:MAG TPA: aldo/keto reductase [Micropepsaceae bacterium]|nr:aldo/keto reductase [Micropepsaceae bacterium]